MKSNDMLKTELLASLISLGRTQFVFGIEHDKFDEAFRNNQLSLPKMLSSLNKRRSLFTYSHISCFLNTEQPSGEFETITH